MPARSAREQRQAISGTGLHDRSHVQPSILGAGALALDAPQVFLDGVIRESGAPLHLGLRGALDQHRLQLRTVLVELRGASQGLPLGAGPFEARFGAPADLLGLVLGKVAEDRQENVAHQLVLRREVRLGERAKVHAQRLELLQVAHRLADALAAEAIQAPEDERVELPPLSSLEHLPEGLALAAPLAAGLVIDELFGQGISFAFDKAAEL